MLKISRHIYLFSVLVLVLSMSCAWGQSSLPSAHITDVRASSYAGKTRFVIETNEAVEGQFYLMRNPDSLIVEMVGVRPVVGVQVSKPRGGLVKRVRVAPINLSRSKIAIHLNYGISIDQVEVSYLQSPNRFVVDIDPNILESDKVWLTQGVQWVREHFIERGHYLVANRLWFYPNDPHVNLDVGLAYGRLDRREKLSAMVKRCGALAGINGGYFNPSLGAAGLVVRNGKTLMPHVGYRPARTAFGITNQGKLLMDRVKALKGEIVDLKGEAWKDLRKALGGGPRVVKDGQVYLTTNAEALGPGGNDITRVTGRTALGFAKDDRVMLATVAGYSNSHSQGVTLGHLGHLMLRWGAYQALNYDGGSSVDMVVGGAVVSGGPGSPNYERPVASAWLVYDDRPKLIPYSFMAEETVIQLDGSGHNYKDVAIEVRDALGNKVPDGAVVRLKPYRVQVDKGSCEVENGKIYFRVGGLKHFQVGRVRLECGASSAELDVLHKPSAPSQLRYRLSRPKKTNVGGFVGQRRELLLQLDDEFGNPLSGLPISLNSNGVDLGSSKTEPLGVSRWDLVYPSSGGKLEVNFGNGLKSFSLVIPPI